MEPKYTRAKPPPWRARLDFLPGAPPAWSAPVALLLIGGVHIVRQSSWTQSVVDHTGVAVSSPSLGHALVEAGAEVRPRDRDGGAETVVDNIGRCVARIVASGDGGESQLDKKLAEGVKVRKVPPSVTGFPAWKRREDYVYFAEDHDRGHADWLVPESATQETPRILYCHGGGYNYYSPQDVYRPATTRLAKVTGMPVFAFDYRLAPEFKYPTPLTDAIEALKYLSEHGPEGPGNATALFLAGDSAGGGLALSLAVYLRDNPIEGIRIAGVSVVSPETDLTCGGESYTSRVWQPGGGPQCDPMFREADPAKASMESIYSLLGWPNSNGFTPPDKADLSPLHKELHDLPPTHIHVGDAEVMRSDSVDFAEKAKKAGSPVDVTVWPRMWHTFTQFTEGCGGFGAKPLEDAQAALEQQGDFLRGLAKGLGLVVP